MTAKPRPAATVFTTPSDRELVATRFFAAPRELVWEAFVEPRHLQHWLLGPEGWTMPVCEVDPRPGGRWRFVWRMGTGGDTLEMSGEYRELERPCRLVYTESWGGDWPECLNAAEFREKEGGTEVATTIAYPDRAALERARATGMEDGWAYTHVRLDRYLAELAGSRGG